MECRRCNHENESSANFCEQCANPLPRAAASLWHRLAIMSLPVYGLALALPAVRLGDLLFGWTATYFSFVGIGLFANWGSNDEAFWYPIACAMGAVATVSFLVGYTAYLTLAVRGRGIRLTCWAATLGSCLSLLVIIPLALSSELGGVYIGHGLWVASLLALAIGSWRVQQTRRQEAKAASQ